MFRVMGYSGEFRQALLNLLLNAKDAISTRREQGAPSLPGEITITLKVVAQTVTIVVCDNGTGVSADVRDRLFDPYFTTKRRAEGVGIGLYMVKMLIEKSMHGRVDLLPTEEAGACFEIGLPLAGGEK